MPAFTITFLPDLSVYWTPVAVAYLNPIKSRENLTIVTHAQVEKIVIEGTRATGVQYTDRSGKKVIVKAGKEI
ncbi:MAG: GMC family oxidoreductase N-terminal domain-containing protein, partial [Pseudomonadota bacterium]